ncbi:MAG: hypothetical protein AB8B55_18820 [Mariniblastus sp.]
MNGQIIVGQVLLWAGFLSGSLASVFQIKSVPNEWSTINWPWFIASIVIGAIGIAIFRAGRKSSADQGEKIQAEYKTLKPTIERLAKSVANLKHDLPNLAPTQITAQIDSTCAEDFNAFVEARESIIGEKGLPEYANVMTEFAAAERAVNRAWSAGADGYVDEVESCLTRAGNLLENAKAML